MSCAGQHLKKHVYLRLTARRKPRAKSYCYTWPSVSPQELQGVETLLHHIFAAQPAFCSILPMHLLLIDLAYVV